MIRHAFIVVVAIGCSSQESHLDAEWSVEAELRGIAWSPAIHIDKDDRVRLRVAVDDDDALGQVDRYLNELPDAKFQGYVHRYREAWIDVHRQDVLAILDWPQVVSVHSADDAMGSGGSGGDTTPPSGSIVVQAKDGDLNYTPVVSVDLNFAGVSDDVAITNYCVKMGTACGWIAYQSLRPYQLSPTGNGTRTATARFKDAAGNVSAYLTDTIVLDTTAPQGGSVILTKNALEHVLSWSGFTDNFVVDQYRVVYREDTNVSPSCNATNALLLYEGAATTIAHSNLDDARKYAYRVCAIDLAGNISSGKAVYTQASDDVTAPSGSVVVNNGDVQTGSRTVNLTISATDTQNTVTEMCLGNSTTSCAWRTYATSASFTFSNGNGARSIWIKFKDTEGNISEFISDSIIVDDTYPVDGTVNTVISDGQIDISLLNFSDVGGIAEYRLVQGATSIPSNCSVGSLIYQGLNTSITLNGLTNGTNYFFRACAVDNYGRISTGRAFSARPIPEVDAPTGTIEIDSTEVTREYVMDILLDPDDASEVTDYCIFEFAQSCVWKPVGAAGNVEFAVSYTFQSAGLRLLYVRFRDEWGNTSTPVMDEVIIDRSAPTGGGATAVVTGNDAQVNWTGFVDSISWVDGYFVSGPAAAPPALRCTASPNDVGDTTTISFNDLGLGIWYVRVCAYDAIGNISDGRVAKIVITGS